MDALIIDHGSHTIRAGLSSLDAPRLYRSQIGRPKYSKLLGTKPMDALFVGETLRKQLATWSYPISHGEIVDFDGMHMFWDDIFASLPAGDPETLPVVFTDNPFSSIKNKERVAEVFFEEYGSPSLLFSYQNVLSLLSVGRVSGVSIHLGYGVTSVVVVRDGVIDEEHLMRSNHSPQLAFERFGDTSNWSDVLKEAGCIEETGSEMVERLSKMKPILEKFEFKAEESPEVPTSAWRGGVVLSRMDGFAGFGLRRERYLEDPFMVYRMFLD